MVFRAPRRVPRDTPIHQAGVASPRAATATLSPRRAQRRAGVTVSDAPVVLRTGDEAAWLFYEDRGPYQAYQHPGRVVLVGATSGRVRVSRSLRWPPLIDGELPPFLAGYEAYRERRYRAFVRGWALKAPASSRATASLLKPTAPDYVGSLRAAPPATPARRQAADQLAAERSCAIRISDTLGSFYDAGPVDRTRQSLGTLFNRLARLNPQFFTARYRYREGRTPAQFVARAIEQRGCKDVLLYLGGGGYAGASPAVNVGTRGLGDGRIEQQVVTLAAVRSMLRAHRDVTFKVLVDAPYSGAFLPVLQRESNLLFFASSSGAGEAAFTALADVVDGRDRPVANDYNRRGFLEFTNRMLTGLNCFLSRPDEVAAAARAKAEGRTRSFLAWMLGRSFSVCAAGSLGDRVAGGPTPTIYVAGGLPGDPAPTNRAPVAIAGSVTTAEDTPVAITLRGTDADGDALTYAVTGGPSHGRIAAAPGNGAELVYTPDADAHGSDSLRFTVSDGKASSTAATVTIAVAAVDDAPVVTLGGGTTTFTEPGPAVAVAPALDVSDVDDTELVRATVQITRGHGDELVFVDQAGISGDYDAVTGTLTLTGDAALADYRTALRSITFANDSANPLADTREAIFVVDDGERTSAPVVRPVAFATVNDAPALGGGGTTAAYSEDDQTGVLVAPAVTVADVDNSTLASATLAISVGHAASEDELTFVDQAGISGAFDATTGVLTLTGEATKAEYQAALRSVRYRNLNLGAPSTVTRTVSLQVDDGATASATSAPITTGVTVAAVNDAPTTAAGGGSPSYSEGAAPVVVDSGVSVADVDDADIESATVAIGTGFDSADDRLELPVVPPGLTAAFSPLTGELTISGTATKAVYQAALRTVTYVNDDGDDPSTASRAISFTADDGDLDGAPATIALSVVGVNDAPTLTGGGNTVEFEEDDTAGVIVNAAITVADVDNANQASATVALTTGFDATEDELLFVDQAGISGSYDATTGVLTLTGSATKAEYETALRSVRYRNTNTGDPSTTSRVVQFRIDDGAATSNVSSAVVSTVDVDPSNDAPQVVAGGGSPSFTEGATAITVDPDLAVTDADDTMLTGATVTIGSGFVSGEDVLAFTGTATISGTYLSATGVLTLTGTDTVAAYQAALRSVTYAALTDDPSTTSRELEFRVSDATLTSLAATTTVEIAPVNDAPTLGGAAAAVTYTENDSAGVVVDTALTVADVDSTDLAGATVSLTSGFAAAEDELRFVDQNGISGDYDAATGVLTLTGSATKADYQAALRSVRYRNGSDDPSTATRTFSIQVSDGATANALSAARTGTVAVDAVNDAPTVTTGSTSASFLEDSLTGVVIDSTVTVADVDSPTISSATVAISGNFVSGEDVLALPTTSGLTAFYNPGAGVLTITGVATPAIYAAALRTVTYANTNTEDPATVDRGIDFAVSDGTATSANAFATVSVVTVNDAPTVSLLAGSAAFVEATSADPGSGPVAVDGSALVADVDDSDLAGATLTISANLSADDRLLFTDQNGIAGVYTAATGTLALSGTATVAEYQAAIRSVRFETLGDVPSTDVRTVTVQVTDGDDPSTTETRDVSVAASDDLPTVTLSGSAPDFTEAGSPVVVDGGLTVADVDSDDLQSATVCICSGRVDAEDELLYTTTNGITATAYDAATGTLTLSGPGTKADFEAALRTVEYRNTDLVTPDPGPRGIDFVVDDGSSDSVAATKTLTITTLNDPPVLGGGGNTVSYTEDDAATIVNGALTVTDNDDTELDGATVTITAGFDADEDVLALPSTPGLSSAYDDATGVLTITGTATEAVYEAALRTVMYVNDDDAAPSSADRTVGFVANDGEEDSDPAATTTITIAQNPDAPTVAADTDAPASFTENGSAVVVDDGLTVADVDSAALSGATVDITSGFSAAQGDVLSFTPTGSISGAYNATTGVLTLSGSGTKAEYQSVLRSVTYANTSEDPTTSRTVRFRVTDETSTVSAGATRTVDIVPVNDAPTLAGGGTLNYTENDAATAISTGVTVADLDNPNVSGASVAITGGLASGQDRLSFTASGGITGSYSTGTGVLTLTGTATTAQYQTVLRTVAYDNMSDDPSTAARTVTYTVLDTGTPPLPGTTTATVNVTAVNDDPVADDESFSGSDSAIGNTSFVGDDPTDGAPNPTGPQKTITADVLSGDTDVEGDTVSVVPGTLASNDGGSVTIEADGDFTYTPATGTSCSDASDFFGYTVTDGQSPTPGTDTGRVTIAITDCVWYVDNQAAAGGNGRSGTPFDTLAEADTAATTTGAYLYVYRGTGTTTGLTGGASLLANQRLVGAAETLTVGSTTLETGDDAQRPSISGRVQLGSGNVVEGLAIASSGVNAIEGASGDASGTLDDLVLTPSGAGGGGISLDGTSGTWPISNVTVTATGGAQGIYVNAAGTVQFADAGTITANANAGRGVTIAGTATSGTIDQTTVTSSPTTGVSLTGNSGSLTLDDVALTTAGTGLLVSSSNDVTVRTQPGARGDISSSGTAVDLNTDGAGANPATPPSVALDQVSSSGGAQGITLDDVGSGTFSASGGTLSGHSDAEIEVVGGSGAVGYGGTIGNGSALSARVTGRTAGAITLSGAINDTSDAGGGIAMSGNSGGSTTFSAATKTLSTGASAAVDASFTGNHALRFTGGGLDIDSASGAGFSATTGSASGLVSVTGTGNSITTTTGRALDVNGPDIEAAGLTFQSVASNGAPSGIRLASTGSAGGLTVTGTGSAGSGGTITSSTGAGIDLSSTTGVSLSRLNVANGGDDGIRGVGVSGLVLTANAITGNGNAVNESGLDLAELSGTATLTTATVTGNADNQLAIVNDAATLSNLTVNGGTYGNSSTVVGNDGIQIQNTGSGSTTATIQNATLTMNRGDHVQVTTDASTTTTQNVTILNNTLRGDGNQAGFTTLGGGITANPAGNANSTVTIDGNDIERARDSAIVLNSPLGSSATLKAAIRNNDIGTSGEVDSGSATGNGIYVNGHGNSTITTLIENNDIRRWNNAFGIDVRQNDGDGAVNATVRGNTVAEPSAANGLYGMFFAIGADATDGGTSCLDIGHPTNAALKNQVFDGGATVGDPDIRLTMNGGSAGGLSTALLAGYTGGPHDNAAVNAYLLARNNLGGTPVISSSQFDNFSIYGQIASCPQP